MVRLGMLIDLERCWGCQSCTLACKQENFTPPSIWWNKIFTTERGKYPYARPVNLPTACMHCDNAPCVSVCPTGASHKRPDGIVVVDQDKCIGCKYCIQACPYGAREYVDKIQAYYPEFPITPYEQFGYSKHQVGVVEKCTFCSHRMDEAAKAGLTPGVDRAATPACMITCIAYAREFGDLDDPNSEVSKQIIARSARPLKPELGTKPKVYYVGLPEEW
jgi:molybdopterin-containing oxidoreductase family iron-sulfur binding subunit